jgi:hypothetical protein
MMLDEVAMMVWGASDFFVIACIQGAVNSNVSYFLFLAVRKLNMCKSHGTSLQYF